MASVDFRKPYDLVSHAWIIKASKLIGAAPNFIALLKSTMIDWKTELILRCIILGEVNVNRGIFQGDYLSLLPFVISLIPLALFLRRVKQRSSFQKGNSKLNHLLFVDHLRLYGSNQTEIDSLARTAGIVTKDICMKFGIDKSDF